MSEITVTRRTEDLAEVVTITGEIDIATYRQFRAALVKAVDEGPGSAAGRCMDALASSCRNAGFS